MSANITLSVVSRLMLGEVRSRVPEVRSKNLADWNNRKPPNDAKQFFVFIPWKSVTNQSRTLEEIASDVLTGPAKKLAAFINDARITEFFELPLPMGLRSCRHQCGGVSLRAVLGRDITNDGELVCFDVLCA
jgi:hypothetical protein